METEYDIPNQFSVWVDSHGTVRINQSVPYAISSLAAMNLAVWIIALTGVDLTVVGMHVNRIKAQLGD
jgi:hypothetical protein